MKIGTKSLLFGAHQFVLHPIFVFIAWWKLYGFPKDPRLWVAFIVHDWGYWGKSNMDGKEGETHPELGARIMHWLFDPYRPQKNVQYLDYWYTFTLYHSRFYAKNNNAAISKLCIADKYAFVIPPKWLYMLLVNLTGEINEYITTSRSRINKDDLHNKTQWYYHVAKYMVDYCLAHKDTLDDTWTKTTKQ